ncbi:CAAX prenyl protease 2, partial [Operophtera brumata]
MDFLNGFIAKNGCTSSVLACVLLTISYVASLYVWRTKLSRDHPSTIKRRFFSVSCMMVLTPFFTQYMLTENSLKKGDILQYLGLQPIYWVQSWQDLLWVRNHIMAPLSEEWVFRACMLPILLQCLMPMTA